MIKNIFIPLMVAILITVLSSCSNDEKAIKHVFLNILFRGIREIWFPFYF